MPAEILVVANAKARPGMADALEAALRAVDAPTRAMPGCISFTLYRAVANHGEMTAIEHWASVEDHDRHLASDHVKTLVEQFGLLLAEPPQIIEMQPL